MKQPIQRTSQTQHWFIIIILFTDIVAALKLLAYHSNVFRSLNKPAASRMRENSIQKA